MPAKTCSDPGNPIQTLSLSLSSVGGEEIRRRTFAGVGIPHPLYSTFAVISCFTDSEGRAPTKALKPQRFLARWLIKI